MIPDGEYDVEISDALLGLLSDGLVKQRKNDEILGFKCECFIAYY